jgi:hypothetical protein
MNRMNRMKTDSVAGAGSFSFYPVPLFLFILFILSFNQPRYHGQGLNGAIRGASHSMIPGRSRPAVAMSWPPSLS